MDGRRVNRYLIYVRQSYRRDSDADVSEEQQEAAARRLLPDGSGATVIRDTQGHNSGSTAARDGYARLLEELKAPDVAGVAVYDLSRLARNARLMLNLKHELDGRNLHLIVSNLPDSRFDSAIGRFLFVQLALAAQLQRDLDSERMVGLTRTKHEQGGHNGLDPFGYRTVRDERGQISRPHRLEVVAEEATVVRDIFDRYSSGTVSQGDLAAALNVEGKHRRGRPWVEKGVADILRRGDFYLGNSVYRRGASVRPGSHDPIITPEQRHLAQRVASRRLRAGGHGSASRAYLLTRLSVCGDCGLRLRAETRRSRGKEWAYYRCPGGRDGRCSEVAVRVDRIDPVVIEHLASQRTPPGLVALMREELARMRHLPAEGLSAERTRIEAAMKRLGDRYVWGELEEADYRAQRRVLDARRAELPAPVDSNVIAFDRAAATFLPMATVIRDATLEHQHAIVRHVVESVAIVGGEVVGITMRAEARPFFADYGTAVVEAPPDGLEPPTQALGRPRSVH